MELNIERTLAALAERQKQFEESTSKFFEESKEEHRLAKERFERLEAKAERLEAKAERDHRKAMERWDKHDKEIQATAKLVKVGMKIVLSDRERIKNLEKLQAAFLRSLGNGHNRKNGNGFKRGQ